MLLKCSCVLVKCGRQKETPTYYQTGEGGSILIQSKRKPKDGMETCEGEQPL